MHDNDGWAALMVAVVWHYELDVDKAFEVLRGGNYKKPRLHADIKFLDKIMLKVTHPNFKDWSDIETRYRVSRYDVWEYMNTKFKGRGVMKLIDVKQLCENGEDEPFIYFARGHWEAVAFADSVTRTNGDIVDYKSVHKGWARWVPSHTINKKNKAKTNGCYRFGVDDRSGAFKATWSHVEVIK